jgi:hypothetical protein
MKSLLLAAIAALGLAGCYADDYNPGQGPYPAGAAYNPPAGISVSVAPPAPQYEQPLTCDGDSIYLPGQWDWNGSWYWTSGYCGPPRVGYAWIPPIYANGVYIRGYWGSPAALEFYRVHYGGAWGGYYNRYYSPGYYGGYRAGYGYRGGYAAPGYRGGYAAPGYRGAVAAPGYRGGYAAPGYRGAVAAPGYRGGYAAPRAPAAVYRGGGGGGAVRVAPAARGGHR